MSTSRFLSTLNLVFVIIGYQFATSLLIPVYGGDIEGATRVVTITYRLFTIALATAVIIQSISQYGANIRQTRTTWLLSAFWTMLLLRLFYDLEVRTDFFLLPARRSASGSMPCCFASIADFPWPIATGMWTSNWPSD